MCDACDLADEPEDVDRPEDLASVAAALFGPPDHLHHLQAALLFAAETVDIWNGWAALLVGGLLVAVLVVASRSPADG